MNGFEDLDTRPFRVLYSSKRGVHRDILIVLTKAIWKRLEEVAALHKMTE